MELLEFLDGEKAALDLRMRRMVHLLYRDIRELRKRPMEEFVAWQEPLVRSDDVGTGLGDVG